MIPKNFDFKPSFKASIFGILLCLSAFSFKTANQNKVNSTSNLDFTPILSRYLQFNRDSFDFHRRGKLTDANDKVYLRVHSPFTEQAFKTDLAFPNAERTFIEKEGLGNIYAFFKPTASRKAADVEYNELFKALKACKFITDKGKVESVLKGEIIPNTTDQYYGPSAELQVDIKSGANTLTEERLGSLRNHRIRLRMKYSSDMNCWVNYIKLE